MSKKMHITMIAFLLILLYVGSVFADGPIEPNPHYIGNSNKIITLGDLDNSTLRPIQNTDNNNYVSTSSYYNDPSQRNSYGYQIEDRRPPPSISSLIYGMLQDVSPTIASGMISSVLVFVLWRIPILLNSMQRNFVCSYRNVVKEKRLHSLILSSVSHISFRHLFLNLYVYYSFGSAMERSFHSSLPLWPFFIGSSLFASMAHLILSPKHMSCLGLSGVTMALVAFEARRIPSKRFSVIYLPKVQFYAHHALICLLAGSVFGMIVKNPQDNIAHAAHFGGLTFGILYYELYSRGLIQRLYRKMRVI